MRPIATVVSAAAFALIAACSESLPPSVESPVANMPLPTISARAMDGRSVESAALGGKLLVVQVFSKACARCRATIEDTELLARSGDRGVAIIGISADDYELDTKDLVTTHQISFPVVFDEDHAISHKLGVRQLPMTFVADRHGTVKWVGGPGQGPDDMRKALELLR
jgi:peroxiredoxin